MATIYEIAAAAQTSPATVSRVLNGRSGVKAETSMKIRKAMEELNFQPRWKAMDRHRFLLLVPTFRRVLHSGYVSRILSGVADASFDLNFQLVIRPFNLHRCSYAEIRQVLAEEGAAGCILIPLNEGLQQLLAPIDLKEIPHVVIGHRLQESDLHYLLFNDYQAGCDAVEYLVSTGHRRISLVSFNLTDFGHQQVFQGFSETMRKHGLDGQSGCMHLQFGDDSFDCGRSAARRLLSPRERPTAVVISNENLAAGFLAEAQVMGVSVPGEVSVIAFEDSDALSTVVPAPTVMQKPIYAGGVEAVKILHSQLAEKKKNSPGERIVSCLDIPMIVRHSTAPIDDPVAK